MEHRIKIAVNDKIATKTCDVAYVCGNSDYTIEFTFDEEWDDYPVKTARFVTESMAVHDQVFEGTVCPIPVTSDTYKIRVGVFAGNLRTTTPALIPAKKSILCGTGSPDAPAEDVYAQIMAKVNEAVKTADDVEARANSGEFDGADGRDGVDGVDGTDASVTTHNITAALGYTPADAADVSSLSDEIAKQGKAMVKSVNGVEPDASGNVQVEGGGDYVLPVATADTLGGVKVGEGLQMIDGALGVEPEGEYELIVEDTLTEDVSGWTYPFTGYKKVLISMHTPAASENAYGVFSANGTAPMLYGKMVQTGAAQSYATMERESGRLFSDRGGIGFSGEGALLYEQFSQYPRANYGAAISELESIRIIMLSGKLLPTGTVIKLEGVRE